MNTALIAVYCAGVVSFLLTLALAAEFDIRDWGLAGMALLFAGIATVGALTWLRTHGGADGWDTDLRFLWAALVIVGAAIVGAGIARRFFINFFVNWPPPLVAVGRVVVALTLPLALLVLIHAVRLGVR